MQSIPYDKLTQVDKDLLEKTKESLKYAYNPQSNNYVSASVVMDNGKLYTATNYFGTSTGVNICAERAAVVSANANGERNISRLILVTDFKDTTVPVTPCGICRQFLFGICHEITKSDIEILVAHKNLESALLTSVYELLPAPFFSS